MTEFRAIEAKLDKAAAAAEKAAESVHEQRDERRRSDRIVKVVLVSMAVLLAVLTVFAVLAYKLAVNSEAGRKDGREILRTLAEYSDPTSERSKAGAANTQAAIQQIVDQFSEVVERGTIDTTRAVLEIRRCAFGSLDEFEACIREHLPAEVFMTEDDEAATEVDAE